jgi:GNAT superfamily N-acetyltransferase
MTVTIKPLAERDFFAWYELFTSYAGGMGIEVDDERTMRVWTSLQGDDAHAVVAFDDESRAVGFALFTVYKRLVQGDTGYTIEDLYVAEHARGKGVATALIEHIRTRAEEEHRATVRWATRPEDPAARALYEKFTASAGDWVLRDLPVG